MFDENAHKKAIAEFITYLRTISSQKELAFFSDCSREYMRDLEKGKSIPTIRLLCNYIEAAHMDIKEGLCLYVDMLYGESKIVEAEKKNKQNP